MRRRAIAGSFRITTSTLVSLTAARAMSSAAGCSPETPSLRCQEGFLGQARGRSSVQLRGRRHRGVGTRGTLLHCQPQQRRDFPGAGKRHRRGLWRPAADRCPLAHMVPERPAAVHAAIPICRREQVEPGRENPNRPAFPDDRRSGSGHLVRAAPQAWWEHWPTGRLLWLSDRRSR
jgi:hypothetical protein